MNNNILYFVGGVAVGAVTTYFSLRTYFRNKMEEELDIEINDYKNYIDSKYDDKISEKICEDKESKEIISNDIEETVIEETKNIDRVEKPDINVEPDYEEIIEKLNYNQFSTKTKGSKKKKPYLISVSEYEEGRYDKVSLSYFDEDDILFNNNTNEVVDDPGNTVGHSNLESLASEEMEEIYVRNDILGVDYNVILELGSYHDFAGLDGEDW